MMKDKQVALLTNLFTLFVGSKAFLCPSSCSYFGDTRIPAISTYCIPPTIFEGPTTNSKKNNHHSARMSLWRRPSFFRIGSQSQFGDDDMEEAEEEKVSGWNSSWLNVDELQKLSRTSSLSIDEILAQHVDVTYYDSDHNDDDHSSSPSYFHIRGRSSTSTSLTSNLSRDTFQKQMLAISKMRSTTTDENKSLKNAHEAAVATYNWCSHFVQSLNLCPWAKQSLLSINAIRMKIMHQNNGGWDSMEQIVRQSSLELKGLTDEGIVDPYIGITFVVAIPSTSPDDGFDNQDVDGVDDFDFLTFYDYFNDIEEEFTDEHDDDNNNKAFNDVTIAPFHPNWTFAPSSYDDDHNNEDTSLDPLDYEKRTPYPTISIVMAKGIDLAGEEATDKIGVHNEETLNELGYENVRRIYDENVLEKKSSRFVDGLGSM